MEEGIILRGKVTAHLGDENKGLVEISLGGYQEGQDTVYARVQQSMRGVYWLPEIGDVVEVRVSPSPGYEAQILRIHRPQGDAQTEACWTENNDRKQLTTRSGHTLTLDDTQDKTSILLQSAGGLLLYLDDEAQQITVKGKDADTPVFCLDLKNDALSLSAAKKLTLSCGGSTIEADDSGNVSIQAKAKLEFNAQEIALKAQSKLTAQGQQVEVSGGMTTKVEGQTKLELSSSTTTSIKGGMIQLN